MNELSLGEEALDEFDMTDRDERALRFYLSLDCVLSRPYLAQLVQWDVKCLLLGLFFTIDERLG